MTIKDLQDRAVALSDKYQVGSVTPKDIGDLFNDFMTYVYTLQQNFSSIGIRKIYASYRDMVNDLEPTANGFKLKFGQLVAIASEDEDAGKIYSFTGGQTSNIGELQWSYVGKVAQLTAILNEFYEMQSTLSTMSKQLSAHTIDLQAIHESLSSQSTVVGNNTIDIGKLQKALGDQSTAISGNTKNIGNLQTALNGLSSAVSQNETEISKLKTASISSVDVSQLDSLTVLLIGSRGHADLWLTNKLGDSNFIVGRVFMFEDLLRHKVTQVVLSNQSLEGFPMGSHTAEGLTIFYRFFGRTDDDVEKNAWTNWKILFNSDSSTKIETIAASVGELQESLAVYEATMNDAITTLYSSNPPFIEIDASTGITIEKASISSNYSVVYLQSTGTFVAKALGKYYSNWGTWGKYPLGKAYGVFTLAGYTPVPGKVYVKGAEFWMFDGSTLDKIN